MHSEPSAHPHLEAALRALQRRAWSHSVTIRLARITANRETAYNTASGILIEFGGRMIIGTAWHVLEEYVRLRSIGEKVYIVADNMPIVEPRIVWRDEENDSAFLEVPETGRSGIGAIPYRPGPRLWPPPAVRAGDSVVLCGFPKLLRTDGDNILHGDLNFAVGVESASESYFMLQIEIDNLVQLGRETISSDVTDFGGVSGGPVFLVDMGGNPLVGLVSQAGESLPLWRIAPLANAPDDIEARPSVLLWDV